jgi:hypothetical protein
MHAVPLARSPFATRVQLWDFDIHEALQWLRSGATQPPAIGPSGYLHPILPLSPAYRTQRSASYLRPSDPLFPPYWHTMVVGSGDSEDASMPTTPVDGARLRVALAVAVCFPFIVVAALRELLRLLGLRLSHVPHRLQCSQRLLPCALRRWR